MSTRIPNQKGYGLLSSLVSLFFGFIVAIVAFRFVFRLIGANPANSIVAWIYNASQPLVAPFFGILGHDINVAVGRFELDTLVALIVYSVIASLVSHAFGGFYGRPRAI
jgi:uncharacterized protein YggT (Ycf19 family)